jgi:site-specific DNA-methyltransferase (adenine-specific)
MSFDSADLGPAVIYRGDALEVLRTLPAESVDAVIADPPYGTTANDWDRVIPFGEMWHALERCAKPSAAFVFTASQPFSSALVMSRPELFRHEWVWIKNRGSNFANTVREPMKEHEVVLVFSRGKWTYNPQKQRRTGGGESRVDYKFGFRSKSSNYRDFDERNNLTLPKERVPSSWQKFNTEVGHHPNQKPVRLMEYLVATYSNEGETVIDFTAGSGTTGVACVHLGRRFIGVERDPAHFATACRRIREAVAADASSLFPAYPPPERTATR